MAEQSGLPLNGFHYWGRGDDQDARPTRVRPMFLEHGLALADVRLALEQAAQRHRCVIETRQDEVELRRARLWDEVRVMADKGGKKERIVITPDGYVVLVSQRGRAHFFLEVDRSTESIANSWKRKLLGYKEYALGGHFHRRYGIANLQIGFRVLTTTSSLSRAQHLKAAAERYGSPEAASRFLFAPLTDVLAHNPLSDPIWLRAEAGGLHALL